MKTTSSVGSLAARISLLLLACTLTASCQTAEPYTWNASTYPPQTARIQIWRGDTLPLAPAWGRTDTNSWTFTTYWSTNNITWWSKSFVLDPAPTIIGNPFTWTPDMDVGASKYRLFILASNTGGGSYRANADISMLASPGAVPNLLPLPVLSIDFALVSAHNAPWVLPIDLQNAVALLATTTSVVAVASSLHSLSNALTQHSAAINTLQTNRTDKLWSTAANYMDGAGNFYRITTRPYNTLTCVEPASPSFHWLVGEKWEEIYPDMPGVYFSVSNSMSPVFYDGYRYELAYTAEGGLFIDTDGNANYQNPFNMYEMNAGMTSIWMLRETSGVTTNLITRVATSNELATAIAAIPLPPANAVSGWLLFDSGSNIWLRVSVSNLSFTVEEVL